MNALTFESLRIALDDGGARVRIEDEIPLAVPFIRGIRMPGGFLDGQCIHFGPNLNCIIGGRGMGKSTTFEAIRCLTGQGRAYRVMGGELQSELTHTRSSRSNVISLICAAIVPRIASGRE